MFGTDKISFIRDDAISKESIATEENVQDVTDLEHYRDLHLVLSRILWHSLKLNIALEPQKSPLKFKIIASFRPEDIHLLHQYCGPNKTLSDRISPDIINSIFSRFIETVSMLEHDPQPWLYNFIPHFELTGFMGIILITTLILILVLIRRKFIGFLLLFIIVLQELRQKYKTRLAQKMATMSRYNGPPEQCRNEQSWIYWILSNFKIRPKSDECAEYYESLMTDPLLETSLYDALLDVFFRPLINLSSAFGKSAGLLYHHLSEYIPFYMIPCLFCLSIVSIVLLFRLLLSLTVRRPKMTMVSKRSQKIRSKLPQVSIDNNQQKKQT